MLRRATRSSVLNELDELAERLRPHVLAAPLVHRINAVGLRQQGVDLVRLMAELSCFVGEAVNDATVRQALKPDHMPCACVHEGVFAVED